MSVLLGARDSGASHSSHIPTVAIGIGAGVGGLLLFSLVLRIVTRSRKQPNIPLPPVQMLAHQRQRQQEAYLRRNISTHLNHATTGIESPSSACLLREDSMMPIRPEDLQRTNPVQSPSSMSSPSSKDGSPTSDTRRDRHMSHLSSSSHLRPKSSLSSVISSISGPSHARHSRVEIVLPSPLAIQSDDPTSNRLSVYDTWTPPLSRSTSRTRRSSESDAQARPSFNRWSPDTSDAPPVPPVPIMYLQTTSLSSSIPVSSAIPP